MPSCSTRCSTIEQSGKMIDQEQTCTQIFVNVGNSILTLVAKAVITIAITDLDFQLRRYLGQMDHYCSTVAAGAMRCHLRKIGPGYSCCFDFCAECYRTQKHQLVFG